MMNHGFVPVFMASIVAFVAANTDDLITLVVFMAQIDAQHYHVFIGQFLGFTVLTAFSLLGLVFGKFIPTEYLGLLGFLPLFNGCWKMYNQIRNTCRRRAETRSTASSVDSDSEIEKEIEDIKMLVEIEADHENNPAKKLLDDKRTEDEEAHTIADEEGISVGVKSGHNAGNLHSWSKAALLQVISILKLIFHARAIEVALVVIGDGGDSLTSALPLFATESAGEILLTLTIFYIATFILCSVAYVLIKCSLIARFMQKYGMWVRPLMLMALGVYILSDSILGSLILGGDGDDD